MRRASSKNFDCCGLGIGLRVFDRPARVQGTGGCNYHHSAHAGEKLSDLQSVIGSTFGAPYGSRARLFRLKNLAVQGSTSKRKAGGPGRASGWRSAGVAPRRHADTIFQRMFYFQRMSGKHHDARSASKARAAFMSSVSKPSVNQP